MFLTSSQSNKVIRGKEIDRQREVDRESGGSGPAEAAVRLKARRKELGNTDHRCLSSSALCFQLELRGSVEIR